MAVRKPSAKPGAAQIANVRKMLDAGWPAGLTVLTGDDVYHLDLAQRLLLERLAPEADGDFALTVFGEDDVAVSVIVSAARSVGMFAPRRVVFVQGVSAFDGEPDALEEYAKHPPACSYLIVRALELDQRFKLHKAIATLGTTLVFSAGADPREEIRALAGERGVRLAPPALEWLAQATGGDLYRVVSELDKLQSWQGEGGKGGTIDLATVRDLVPVGDAMTGWELSDAITVRDREGALAAVRILLDRGAEPLMLLGGVAARARAMLQAKAMATRRVPEQVIVSTTRCFMWKGQMLRGLQRYTLDELLAFPDLVRGADRALKGSRLGPEVILGDLVERMMPPRPGLLKKERR